ncbi:hypothetical protein A0H81_01780 [Grifola frondosa]|uniref:Uncharacterized protein n=1 Tax=Grifola frondosa TaxID=5627 RepID=A0A1C7MKA0_GRIFR|nr:hypothetical protein A0H81_01780 [Grifola frondosa]
MEPYHTSVLTGIGWVLELMSDYPDHIHCELGVSHDVFIALFDILCEMDHEDSQGIIRFLKKSIQISDCFHTLRMLSVLLIIVTLMPPPLYMHDPFFAITKMFIYALTGWEGSASDACVYENALAEGLNIPPN